MTTSKNTQKTAKKSVVSKMPAYPTKAKSLKELQAFIDESCVRMDKLKDRIQVSIVMITQHFLANGDYPTSCRLFNQLVDNMGKTGLQAKGLIMWIEQFVGGTIGDIESENGKTKGFVSLDIEIAKARWNASSTLPKELKLGAKGTHWVTFTPKTPWAGFDFDAKLDGLLKSVATAQEKASQPENENAPVSINTDLVQAIELVKSMTTAQLLAFKASFNTVESEQETQEESTQNVA